MKENVKRDIFLSCIRSSFSTFLQLLSRIRYPRSGKPYYTDFCRKQRTSSYLIRKFMKIHSVCGRENCRWKFPLLSLFLPATVVSRHLCRTFHSRSSHRGSLRFLLYPIEGSTFIDTTFIGSRYSRESFNSNSFLGRIRMTELAIFAGTVENFAEKRTKIRAHLLIYTKKVIET